MTFAARRRLRDKELERFRRRVELDPSAHSALRVARVRQDLTIAELAQLADLSTNTVGGLERGAARGSRSTRRRLARVLERPCASLFGDPRGR